MLIGLVLVAVVGYMYMRHRSSSTAATQTVLVPTNSGTAAGTVPLLVPQAGNTAGVAAATPGASTPAVSALLGAYNFAGTQAQSANGQAVNPTTGQIFDSSGNVVGQATPAPGGAWYIPGPGPGGIVGIAEPNPSGGGFTTFSGSGQLAGEWIPLGTAPPPAQPMAPIAAISPGASSAAVTAGPLAPATLFTAPSYRPLPVLH